MKKLLFGSLFVLVAMSVGGQDAKTQIEDVYLRRKAALYKASFGAIHATFGDYTGETPSEDGIPTKIKVQGWVDSATSSLSRLSTKRKSLPGYASVVVVIEKPVHGSYLYHVEFSYTDVVSVLATGKVVAADLWTRQVPGFATKTLVSTSIQESIEALAADFESALEKANP